MPYINEHSAKIKDPEVFQQNSFDRKPIADGVELVFGKLSNEDTEVEQAYRFNKDKFTPDQAKQWLTQNNVEYLAFENAGMPNKIGNIYIYGIISPEKMKTGAKKNLVGLTDVVAQILQNKDAELLKVHINSEGGDVNEGFEIHDALISSGKQIETIGEGIVASIATVIFLSGSVRTMSQNAEFIIHNPWSGGKGTSKDFQEAADMLKLSEDRLLAFYNKKTGTASEILKKLMERETIFTADQAKSYGFATEVQQIYKAVALFNINKNKNEMNKEELDVAMDKKLDGFFSKMKGLFGKAKALVITTGDGSMLDFGEEIQEESQIIVGSAAKLEDGNSPEGDYVMTDGRTITFAAGVITAIVEPDPNAEAEAMKAKITELEAENETLKTQSAEYESNLTTVKAEFTTLKGQIKSDMDTFMKDNKLKVEDEPEGRHLKKKRD